MKKGNYENGLEALVGLLYEFLVHKKIINAAEFNKYIKRDSKKANKSKKK